MSKIEKSIDVNVPVRTAYNQWTQFEEFPMFMEGVEEVTQLDDSHLRWCAEIGGVEREWDSEITEQIPDQRIAWRSTSGPANSGVVTFQKLNDDETRIYLEMDYEPEGVVETVGDFIGVASARVAGDLERFKDFVEERGVETGAWRGTISSPSSVSEKSRPQSSTDWNTVAPKPRARKSPAKRPAKSAAAAKSTSAVKKPASGGTKTAAAKKAKPKTSAAKRSTARPLAKAKSAVKSAVAAVKKKLSPAKKTAAKTTKPKSKPAAKAKTRAPVKKTAGAAKKPVSKGKTSAKPKTAAKAKTAAKKPAKKASATKAKSSVKSASAKKSASSRKAKPAAKSKKR